MKIILPYREYRRLQSKSLKAQRNDFHEVCGIMLIGAKRYIELIFTKNRSERRGSYRIDGIDIDEITKLAKRHRRRVLGTFHSHPISEAVPGKSDIGNSKRNSVQLIYDVIGHEVGLWRIVLKGRKKVAVKIELILQKRKAASSASILRAKTSSK